MTENNLLNKQRYFFENTHELMTIDNHIQRNLDPEYYGILLKEILDNKERWKGKNALDFGCGCGRNIKNLLELCDWNIVDGCDISLKNAVYAKKWVSQWFDEKRINTWQNSGAEVFPALDSFYDFIMSSIVFCHIPNYLIRFSIIKDLYRTLRPGGLISLHFMDLTDSVSYYETSEEIKNCRVENSDFLIDDFKKIGFKEVECIIGKDFHIGVNSYYVKGSK